MNKRLLATIAGVVLATLVGTPDERLIAAQQAPRLTPLKVQVVLSRYDGERKISSMPYTLWVTSSTGEGAAQSLSVSLRMGIQVPIASVVKDAPTITFRDVGTNIDCSAVTVEEGQFRLSLTVVQNSIHTDDKKAQSGTVTANIAAGVPILRSFTSRFSPLLRDGQTGQYMTATDPVSGEVLKIDATVNVLK